LQFKDQSPILVVDAPEEFRSEIDAMRGVARVATRAAGSKTYRCVICFVRSRAELAATAVPAVARLADDGLLWFAYPKKSSKRYASDLGRDHGWQPLGDLGFEGVRMISIDDDWSALRLRRAGHIPSMKRDAKRAMSEQGQRRLRK
jgi:hypothetical protein